MPNFYINFLNKTVKSLSILCGFAVAPFTGAWIKIGVKATAPLTSSVSHPSRVRGLKYNLRFICPITNTVAPFTGAWIKISLSGILGIV